MTGLPARIAALAQLSLQDPRAATRALLAEDVPLAARTGGLVLMAVLSALLLQPSLAMVPLEDDPLAAFLAQSPLQTAVVEWLVLLLSAILVHRIGARFGGVGRFPDALLLTVWLQLLMLGVQVVQILVQVLLPPLAGLVGLMGLALFLWLAVNFIAELHGFQSLGSVLVGVVATFLGAAFLAAMALTLILGPEALQNV